VELLRGRQRGARSETDFQNKNYCNFSFFLIAEIVSTTTGEHTDMYSLPRLLNSKILKYFHYEAADRYKFYETLLLDFLGDFRDNDDVTVKFYVQCADLAYEEAVMACEAHGMSLFQTSTPRATQALSVALKTRFGAQNGTKLWIDGMISPACQMMIGSGKRVSGKTSPCDNKLWSVCETAAHE
jgi:hypothetical protein